MRLNPGGGGRLRIFWRIADKEEKSNPIMTTETKAAERPASNFVLDSKQREFGLFLKFQAVCCEQPSWFQNLPALFWMLSSSSQTLCSDAGYLTASSASRHQGDKRVSMSSWTRDGFK